MSDLKLEYKHEDYSIFTLNHLCPAARQTREMKNKNSILQRFKILLVSIKNLLYYICCVCIPPKPKLLVFTMNDCIIYNIFNIDQNQKKIVFAQININDQRMFSKILRFKNEYHKDTSVGLYYFYFGDSIN